MEVENIIYDATKHFESILHTEDARTIRSSSIQDVLDAARIFERELEQHGVVRNLRRVEYLLDELRRLDNVLGQIPQYHSYGCYTWGPVKVTLEIAIANSVAFESILDVYGRLANQLSFLKELSGITSFQQHFRSTVAAQTFSDILSYHSYIYRTLRRGGWENLFESAWKEMSPVFECFGKSLSLSRDLVVQELNHQPKIFESINIADHATAQIGDQSYHIQNATFVRSGEYAETQRFREKLLQHLEKDQEHRRQEQLRRCIEWLDLGAHHREQGDLMSRRSDAREQSTCEWILQHPKFKSWFDLDNSKNFLWLSGKPGSGKSTLATYIIEHTIVPRDSLMLHFIISEDLNSDRTDICDLALATLIAQILRIKQDLVSYVFESYAKTMEPLSAKLSLLLRQLLQSIPGTYIVLDGLNECEPEVQVRLFNKLESVASVRKNESLLSPEVKILICSQDAKGTPPKLRKQPSISLTDEPELVGRDIKHYTLNRLAELYERFDHDAVEKVASEIVRKANGMFLWVKLVVSTLLEQESLYDLHNTVMQLPSRLTGIYALLFRRLEGRAEAQQKRRIHMIFYWLLFASRPMKTWEVCDALVIGGDGHVLNGNTTALSPHVLSLCKPLVEIQKDSTLSLIHFSVKQYLLHDVSSPFKERLHAFHHISLTCLRYLFTCGDFFAGSASIETYHQIVTQLHNLFPYVAKFWKDHLKSLVSLSDTGIPVESTKAFLSGFILECSTASKTQGTREFFDTGLIDADQPSLVQQAQKINMNNKSIYRVLIHSLDTASESESPASLLAPTRQHPPVSVDDAFDCFQEQFDRLLSNQCPYTIEELRVSQSDVESFRSRYSKAAVYCRWKSCSRSLRGFDQVGDRDKHEQTHRQQFCCPEPGCDFGANGFSSGAALKRHLQRYHSTQHDHLGDSTMELLASVRKRAMRRTQNQTERTWGFRDSPFQDFQRLTETKTNQKMSDLPKMTGSEFPMVREEGELIWSRGVSFAPHDLDAGSSQVEAPVDKPVHPRPPYEQFCDHMRPQLEADHYPRDQIQARIDGEWRRLSAENRALWDRRYDDMLKAYMASISGWTRGLTGSAAEPGRERTHYNVSPVPAVVNSPLVHETTPAYHSKMAQKFESLIYTNKVGQSASIKDYKDVLNHEASDLRDFGNSSGNAENNTNRNNGMLPRLSELLNNRNNGMLPSLSKLLSDTDRPRSPHAREPANNSYPNIPDIDTGLYLQGDQRIRVNSYGSPKLTDEENEAIREYFSHFESETT